VKPNIDSVEVHSQRSNKGHPVDGALVGAGSPVTLVKDPNRWCWWNCSEGEEENKTLSLLSASME